MRFYTTVTTLALAAAAVGCASDTANREPASFQEYQNEELSTERQQFIKDTQQELDEVSNEIGRLEVRLQHESQYVDQDQQASWSQELFELKQEQQRMQAQLERARTASDAEWEEMRGTFGVAVDSLQAGVTKVSREIAHVFAGDEDQKGSSGLCPLYIEGVEARVEPQQDSISLVLTTDDKNRVPELQRKANSLAEKQQYPTTGGSKSSSQPLREPGSDATSQASGQTNAGGQAQASASGTTDSEQPIDVSVTTQNTDDGVRIKFVPKNAKLDELRARLERDAERLDEGRCRGMEAVSMRQDTGQAPR